MKEYEKAYKKSIAYKNCKNKYYIFNQEKNIFSLFGNQLEKFQDILNYVLKLGKYFFQNIKLKFLIIIK